MDRGAGDEPAVRSLRVVCLTPSEFREVEALGGCVGTLGKVLGGGTVLAAVVVLVGNTDILGVAGLLAVIFSLPVAIVTAMGLLLWALSLRGRRRGRLELRPSGLHIASEPPVEPIALEHLVRVGRLGRYLHLELRSHREWFVRCPRLQAEDLFDHLVELLEAGGHDCQTHEERGPRR